MPSEFGFTPFMTENEIKKHYRKACLKYHPDKVSLKGLPVTKEVNDQFARLANEYQRFMKQTSYSYSSSSYKPSSSYTSKPSSKPSYASSSKPSPTPESAPKPKKPRCCGFCKKPGHNRSTCKEFKEHKEEQRKQKEEQRKQKEKLNTYIIHQEMMYTAWVDYIFPLPLNKKVGDVIIVPYTDLAGNKREYKHTIVEDDLKKKTFRVNINLKP